MFPTPLLLPLKNEAAWPVSNLRMEPLPKSHLIYHSCVYLVSFGFAIVLMFTFNSWSYGWGGSAVTGVWGFLWMLPGLPGVVILVRQLSGKLSTSIRYLIGGLLVGLPLLAGILPGRIEEAIIRRQAMPLIAAINQYQHRTGSLLKGSWGTSDHFTPVRLPPGCYYASWEGQANYSLVFARPTYPDSAVIYNSQWGWGAND